MPGYDQKRMVEITIAAVHCRPFLLKRMGESGLTTRPMKPLSPILSMMKTLANSAWKVLAGLARCNNFEEGKM
jgi:hypothetical protein